MPEIKKCEIWIEKIQEVKEITHIKQVFQQEET